MSSSSYLLEDVLELIIDHRGKTPKKLGFKGFDEKGIPVLSAKHVKNDILVNIEQMRFVNKELYKKWMPIEVKKGDVIITSEAPLGEVYYLHSNQKYVLGQRVFGLRVNKNLLDPEYLVAWLTSTQGQAKLLERATGSTVQGIKQSELRKIEIELPELNIQKKIAQIRSKLNQKITLNNQINETLEAMAQALFKSWFIDFEPVKAKIEAKDAGQDAEGILLAAMSAISGKDSKALKTLQTTAPEEYAELKAIAEQFPDSLEESELGMIPKGWEIKPLDEIAEYHNGLALQKFRPDDPNDYLPIVKIAELRSGKANHEEKASPDIRENSIINDGDVIFSWSGTLLVDIWCGGKAALNQHLFKVVSENYPKWFFYFYTKYHLSNFQKIANDKAVTMGHIKRSHLKEALCLIPTSELLMIDIIDNLLKHKVDNTLSNKTLTELRDTLLPKLLSGEIDVSNVEIDELLENET